MVKDRLSRRHAVALAGIAALAATAAVVGVVAESSTPKAGWEQACVVPSGTSHCVAVRYDPASQTIWPYPDTPVSALTPGFRIRPLANGGR